MTQQVEPRSPQDIQKRSRILTEAFLRARVQLGLSQEKAASVIGVSLSTFNRLKEAPLKDGSKSFELGVLVVRLFRSLDAIVAGDEESMKSWMTTENSVLRGKPIELISRAEGLVNVLQYLDARRAPI